MSLQNYGPKDPARRAGMHHLIAAQRKAFKDTRKSTIIKLQESGAI